LKELDEATFRSFDGVPQAEISRSEVEAGVDIIILLNEKTGFEIKRRVNVRLQRIQFQSIKKKVKEDFVLSAKT
jgi:tyrosyl-tRNA synthetase